MQEAKTKKHAFASTNKLACYTKRNMAPHRKNRSVFN